MNRMSQLLIAAIIFVLMWSALRVLDAYRPYDDTDTPPQRSGLVIKKDALTGCDYLAYPGLFTFIVGYQLTPRLDGNGKPVCRKEAKQ